MAFDRLLLDRRLGHLGVRRLSSRPCRVDRGRRRLEEGANVPHHRVARPHRQGLGPRSSPCRPFHPLRRHKRRPYPSRLSPLPNDSKNSRQGHQLARHFAKRQAPRIGIAGPHRQAFRHHPHSRFEEHSCDGFALPPRHVQGAQARSLERQVFAGGSVPCDGFGRSHSQAVESWRLCVHQGAFSVPRVRGGVRN